MAKATSAKASDSPIKGKVKLGRGEVSPIFDDYDDSESVHATVYVKLTDVFVHPRNNARDLESYNYSEESIGKLAKQIDETGSLLVPIIISEISPCEDTDYKQYVLVSGFRRIMALETLADETEDPKWITRIPARVANIETHAAYYIVQGIENTREDLSATETGRLMERIIEESGGTMNQSDVADAFGVSASTVSKYLKILELSNPIQSMLEKEELSFSNACILMSDEFEIDESNLLKVAKLGTRYTATVYRELLTKNYGKKDKLDEATTTTTTAKAVKKMVGKGEIQKVYIPFLKGVISELSEKDDLKVKYTIADLQKVRLDLISAMFSEESEFAKEIEPFKAELKKTEDDEKSKDSAKKSADKFIKTQAKNLKKYLDLPLDDEGNRPYPSIAQAMLKVQKDLKALSKTAIEKLGFKFDPEKLDVYTKLTLGQYSENRKASKKRAAEAKVKKDKKAAEEKAEKEKAAAEEKKNTK